MIKIIKGIIRPVRQVITTVWSKRREEKMVDKYLQQLDKDGYFSRRLPESYMEMED